MKTIIILLLLSFNTFAVGKAPVLELPLTEYNQYLDFVTEHENKYIIINKGSQQLVLVDNNEPILSMKVIIGKRGWSTPEQETAITHIITNPAWNVPKSIEKELITNMDNNPEKYKNRKYITSYRDDGSLRITQLPGPANALGKVKFRLSNIGRIFMHDTSAPYLFKRTNRKFSHGCIRLEKPLALVENISEIKYKQSRSSKHHKLSEPIPVYIVNWVRVNG